MTRHLYASRRDDKSAKLKSFQQMAPPPAFSDWRFHPVFKLALTITTLPACRPRIQTARHGFENPSTIQSWRSVRRCERDRDWDWWKDVSCGRLKRGGGTRAVRGGAECHRLHQNKPHGGDVFISALLVLARGFSGVSCDSASVGWLRRRGVVIISAPSPTISLHESTAPANADTSMETRVQCLAS